MTPPDQAAMQIILHAGNARAFAFEALAAAKTGNAPDAEGKMREADQELELAHEVQTELLQSEAQGAAKPASLLLAHAMDHLMNASSERGLIAEIIELYQRK